MDHLLAVLVRTAERLDDETLAAVQAVGQVLLVAGLEVLRVQRRDGRRGCRTKTETAVNPEPVFNPLYSGSSAILRVTFPAASIASTDPKQSSDHVSQSGGSWKQTHQSLCPGCSRRRMDGG